MKDILKFKEFIKEEKQFDCLMFNVHIEQWNNILSLINDSDLYIKSDNKNKFGKEFNTHITLLYGIHPTIENKNNTINFINNINKFKIHLTNVSSFNNDKDGYNILKIDIASEYLIYLRNKIIDLIPNTQTFLNYYPHLTLAYLKKDVDINNYINIINSYLNNIEKDYIIEEAVYSNINYEKDYIKLKIE